MDTLEIIKMDHQGRGIGYLKNKITFVKNALPGEIVLCKLTKETSKYKEAEVVEYKKISEKRKKAFCPYFLNCGGCHLQQLGYQDTLQYKKDKIESIFHHEKIEFPEIKIIENQNPMYYRNKLTLKIKEGKIGFYEEKTHWLQEIKTCFIAEESINAFLPKIKDLHIQNGAITIRSNYNDELLIHIKTNEKIKFQSENFTDFKIVGVVLNDKTIYGDHFFYERMNGFLFKVSFDAFFQINPSITKELFKLLDENIVSTHHVLDLYSGVGTLGIIASKKAKKVFSIELNQNAILDTIENKKLNKCENLFPMLGDTEKVLPKIKEQFDFIIIDPPRNGLDKHSLEHILKSDAETIFYISCNPITLARDLKELTKKYKLKKLYLLDMFSYTYHVECVCVLNRR